MRLRENPNQISSMAQHLIKLNWSSTGFPVLENAVHTSDPARLADFFYFNSALLFDFYGLEGEFDGEMIKGSDLFFAMAGRKEEQDPGFFTAARMAKLDLDEYLSVYALDGKPENSLINRPEERVRILRELGQGLLDDCGGSDDCAFVWMLEKCGGRLHATDNTGFLDRLSKFEGYSDPHHKKAFVLLKILDRLGLFNPEDRENLYIPVDYHLIRMALRTGLVDVTDEGLAHQLSSRQEASQQDDDEIRQVVKLAYKILESESQIDVFVLDEIFWTIGRSCCHYSRPTRCTTCDFTDCTVMKSFDYVCPGRCPLEPICVGARDEAYRGLYEPKIVTTYY
jgi:hypothetical protein